VEDVNAAEFGIRPVVEYVDLTNVLVAMMKPVSLRKFLSLLKDRMWFIILSQTSAAVAR